MCNKQMDSSTSQGKQSAMVCCAPAAVWGTDGRGVERDGSGAGPWSGGCYTCPDGGNRGEDEGGGLQMGKDFFPNLE